VLGDPLYGDPAAASRLQLHGTGLRLRHPVTGEVLRLRSWCPLPASDPLN